MTLLRLQLVTSSRFESTRQVQSFLFYMNVSAVKQSEFIYLHEYLWGKKRNQKMFNECAAMYLSRLPLKSQLVGSQVSC